MIATSIIRNSVCWLLSSVAQSLQMTLSYHDCVLQILFPVFFISFFIDFNSSLSHLVGICLSSPFISLRCSLKVLFNSFRFALYRHAEVLLSYSLTQSSEQLFFFSMAPRFTFHNSTLLAGSPEWQPSYLSISLVILSSNDLKYWSISRPIFAAPQNDSKKIEIVLNSFIQVVDIEFGETKIHKEFQI